MGIDGIGKPTPPHGVEGAAAGLESADGIRLQSTAVESQGVQAISTPGEAQPASLLDRVERGEVSREQYIDYRIDDAVAPFAERLTPDQLEFIRTTLREQLETDPTLIELTRRATTTTQSK